MNKIYDPEHFCPSWCTCCEDNLRLKPKPRVRPRLRIDIPKSYSYIL